MRLLLIPGIGVQELLLILLIVLVLFGAKKLPDLAKGMGNAIKEFRKASKDVETAIKTDDIKSGDIKFEEPQNKA